MEPLGPPAGGRGGVAKIHRNNLKNRRYRNNLIVNELLETIIIIDLLQKPQGKAFN